MNDSRHRNPFGLKQNERTYCFIEGANLYAVCKSIEVEIDYKLLLNHFRENCNLVRASYYTSVNEDQEYNSIRPLLDFLDYNGFAVFTKPAKEFTDSLGRRKIKGSVDIEMTSDMLEAADPHLGRGDHIVLFSGDGDFTYAVGKLQQRGVRVTIVATKTMASDDLRRQADAMVEIDDDAVVNLIEKVRPAAQVAQTRPIRAPVRP